ncbi:DNA processing protein [Flexibacter flexilis DSM 6793]|uniref:DNA processing protein n=1 Tax=Flexibacter flexilis DSM 6793 TaxID=927664 RepID=A0A1I1N310_9BACT|nr:DNA-processing protein DprA [Flexibacter flexilis]SFC91582.1 DNA processing protein [Flexibacter flexilis DSM 6793]
MYHEPNNQTAKHYQLALGFIAGIGDMLTRQLISYCGSAQGVFRQNKGQLMRIPNIGEVLADSIISSRDGALKAAETEIRKAENTGSQILFYTDDNYPERLKSIANAPTVLYLAGNVDLNNPKILGIVGTRRASDYGRRITEEILQELRPHNCLIVSGLAYGIDIAAHRAALREGLPTVGVMASGLDIIYPAEHQVTAATMRETNGGLLTENRFGCTPDAPRFPARNRIIAGMVDAVLVVEAAASGGALITAEIANSYNKDVFAVPGNVHQKSSEGCNNLIFNNKANLVTSAQHIEYLLNWAATDTPTTRNKQKAKPNFEAHSPEETAVLLKLYEQPEIHIDELSWQTQIQISQLASILLQLELQGLVKALAGKKFALTILT